MAYPYYGNQPMQQTMAYGYQQPVPQGQLEQLRAAQAYQQAAQSQQGAGIQWVQGEAGAKAFIVAPGASVLLMDSEGQSFYIKAADGTGMPMPLRIFDYTERQAQPANPPQMQPAVQSQAAPVENYVTREELAAVMQRLEEIERKAPEAHVTRAEEAEKNEKGGQQHGKRSVSAAQ